jgi:hypothetical protein
MGNFVFMCKSCSIKWELNNFKLELIKRMFVQAVHCVDHSDTTNKTKDSRKAKYKILHCNVQFNW